MDAECDLGTEYCQVMKLVCEETITRVPFIVIQTGSKLMCLTTKLNRLIFQILSFTKIKILLSTVVFILLQIMRV